MISLIDIATFFIDELRKRDLVYNTTLFLEAFFKMYPEDSEVEEVNLKVLNKTVDKQLKPVLKQTPAAKEWFYIFLDHMLNEINVAQVNGIRNNFELYPEDAFRYKHNNDARKTIHPDYLSIMYPE